MRLEWSVPSVLLVVLTACRSGLGSAVHTYDQARYPEAIRAFRELESEMSEQSPEAQARYALYRGLTHLALGDARAADRWLRLAWAAYDRDREVFCAQERARLVAAWRAMGRMPSER